MDKILAFSILSSSPADIAAGTGYATRLSWRSGGGKQQAEKATEMRQEEKKVQQSSRTEKKRDARFAPEFYGLNCFESIVPF